MTHTDSKYLTDAAGQTRTEEQAREERVRRAALALRDEPGDKLMDEIETSLRTTFSFRDAIMGAGK